MMGGSCGPTPLLDVMRHASGQEETSPRRVRFVIESLSPGGGIKSQPSVLENVSPFHGRTHVEATFRGSHGRIAGAGVARVRRAFVVGRSASRGRIDERTDPGDGLWKQPRQPQDQIRK